MPATRRKRLGQALLAIGGVFGMFGLYLLSQAQPVTPADGHFAQLLLRFLDPMSAALAGTYAVMLFGVLVGAVGLFILLGEEPR